MTDFEAERDRGQRAAAILRDPIVKEAFDEIRKSYFDFDVMSEPGYVSELFNR